MTVNVLQKELDVFIVTRNADTHLLAGCQLGLKLIETSDEGGGNTARF